MVRNFSDENGTFLEFNEKLSSVFFIGMMTRSILIIRLNRNSERIPRNLLKQSEDPDRITLCL